MLTVTIVIWYLSAGSMKTCLYISTMSWPTMPGAKATRHNRYNQGCVFNPGSSNTAIGKYTEANLDVTGVSR